MVELLLVVTVITAIAAGAAWVSDRVPDAWVEAFARRLEQ